MDSKTFTAKFGPDAFKSEYEMQKSLVKWCRLEAHATVKDRFFAVPNGANKNRVSAAKSKCEGQTPGVPDLVFFAFEKMLFIEMKNGPKCKTSEVQDDFIDLLRTNGHQVRVCHDIATAKEMILAFYA